MVPLTAGEAGTFLPRDAGWRHSGHAGVGGRSLGSRCSLHSVGQRSLGTSPLPPREGAVHPCARSLTERAAPEQELWARRYRRRGALTLLSGRLFSNKTDNE